MMDFGGQVVEFHVQKIAKHVNALWAIARNARIIYMDHSATSHVSVMDSNATRQDHAPRQYVLMEDMEMVVASSVTQGTRHATGQLDIA